MSLMQGELKGKVTNMMTKDQVELMLLKCRLAESLEGYSISNEEAAWCEALRWVLGRDSKDHSFESTIALRTKDYMCED